MEKENWEIIEKKEIYDIKLENFRHLYFYFYFNESIFRTEVNSH